MPLRIVTGDDPDLVISLQNDDGAAVNISTASSVKVALVNLDRTAIVAGPFTAVIGTTGAIWASGVVVVRVPSASSAGITVAAVHSEVEVIIGGLKTTYFGTVRIIVAPGLIP